MLHNTATAAAAATKSARAQSVDAPDERPGEGPREKVVLLYDNTKAHTHRRAARRGRARSTAKRLDSSLLAFSFNPCGPGFPVSFRIRSAGDLLGRKEKCPPGSSGRPAPPRRRSDSSLSRSQNRAIAPTWAQSHFSSTQPALRVSLEKAKLRRLSVSADVRLGGIGARGVPHLRALCAPRSGLVPTRGSPASRALGIALRLARTRFFLLALAPRGRPPRRRAAARHVFGGRIFRARGDRRWLPARGLRGGRGGGARRGGRSAASAPAACVSARSPAGSTARPPGAQTRRAR